MEDFCSGKTFILPSLYFHDTIKEWRDMKSHCLFPQFEHYFFRGHISSGPLLLCYNTFMLDMI